MFKELGQFITKHAWAIIIIWVILLIVSLPLVQVFQSNLEYDTQKFIPKDLGSFEAKDKYDLEFPGEYKNEIITVVESDNKTDAMRFIDELNDTVNSDPSIKNVTGTSSIYDIQRTALVNMTPDLYDGLFDLYDNASEANRELYNATDEVRNTSQNLYYLKDNISTVNNQLRKAVRDAQGSSGQMYAVRDQVVAAHDGMYQLKHGAQDSAFILLGIPVYYKVTWVNTNLSDPSLTESDLNAVALNVTSNFIDANVPDASRSLAHAYLIAFSNEWGKHSGLDAGNRAQTSVDIVAPGFVRDKIPDEQQRGAMLDVLQSFSLSDLTPDLKVDDLRMQDYVISRTMSAKGLTSDADKQRLTGIYALGENPSGSAIDGLVITTVTAGMSDSDRKAAIDLYNLGRDPSTDRVGEFVVNRAIQGLDEDAAGIVRDAWGMDAYPTDEDYDRYVLDKACKGLNDTEQKSVREIYSWGPSPNDTTISSYVLREATKDLNQSESDFIREVYGLGRNASNDTLKSYVCSKVAKELNITGNNTYFAALLDMGRNMTEPQLEAFARDWAYAHGYDDPQIFPDSVVKSLASGRATLYIVTTSDPEDSLNSQDLVRILRGHTAEILKDGSYPGVRAYVTGTSAMAVDTEVSSMNDINNIDKISVVLILIILGLYFRSFLTPFVPLVIIGIAIVACFGLMGIISTQMDIFYLVMTFMVVIMLGAGTDYCVFMLSRYAEERSKGTEVREAVIATVGQAGKSIASSGTTAMIGFGSLTLIDQGIFRSIGIGTATSILLSMLVALTFVPAVLTLAGDKLFWPRKIYNSGSTGITSGVWRAITGSIIKKSKAVILIAILLTIPAILIFTQLTLGNDFVSMLPSSIDSKKGYDLIQSEFGSGAFEKAMIVVTLPYNLTDSSGNYTAESLGEVERISSMIAGVHGVDKVYSMTRPEGTTINYNDLSSYPDTEEEYYRDYMKNNTGLDGRTTLIYVSFSGSPYSEQSQRTIDDIRSKINEYQSGSGKGTTMLLGGGCVGTYEYQKLCTDKYGLVVPIVLIGIFLVLVALLQSIFTPARLVCTLLMSIFWTLAAFITVFQFWMGASVSWILPIILFCVLMGLGVDYDIFLVSRIREEVMNGKTDEEAIEHAVEATGTIITLCGAVMAAAFGSMMISSMMELKEFGFVLCLAIILDATIMRLVVVPSIMVLLKKYNWWMPALPSIGHLKDKSR